MPPVIDRSTAYLTSGFFFPFVSLIQLIIFTSSVAYSLFSSFKTLFKYLIAVWFIINSSSLRFAPSSFVLQHAILAPVSIINYIAVFLFFKNIQLAINRKYPVT